MNRRLTRPAGALGALALAASTLLATTTPAQAAEGDDVALTVNVVDQYGRPAPVALIAFDKDGHGEVPRGTNEAGPAIAATSTFDVPGGESFGFLSQGPWSGFECFGVSPCTAGGSVSATAPVVTVPADTPTTYTVQVTLPSITGGASVGSPLTVQIPAGLQRLNALLATTPYSGLSTTNAVSWLRGGTAIAGAVGSGYTLVRDDAGQPVAARLEPSQAQSAIFAPAGGVQSLTTNAITLVKPAPLATTTKARVAKRFKASEKVTMRVKVKASGGVPDGTVTVSIGTFKTKKSLTNGTVLVNLPRLAPGTYRVKVGYAGTDAFLKSKAKKLTVRVTK